MVCTGNACWQNGKTKASFDRMEDARQTISGKCKIPLHSRALYCLDHLVAVKSSGREGDEGYWLTQGGRSVARSEPCKRLGKTSAYISLR